jgi:hypothetical protein
MIIEHYRDQDLNVLREQVIFGYKDLIGLLPNSRNLEEKYGANYVLWHPEQFGKLNDAWFLVELLESFGYIKIEYDTVLYTFEFNDYDDGKHDFILVRGDGLNVAQAICNGFVAAAEQIKKKKNLF